MERPKNQYYSLRYIEIDPQLNPSVFRFFLVAKAETFFFLFSVKHRWYEKEMNFSTKIFGPKIFAKSFTSDESNFIICRRQK